MSKMVDKIENYLKRYVNNIERENVILFIDMLQHKKISKNETIIEYGRPTNKFYILEEGIVGSFVQSEDNNQFIRTLYNKGMAFGALSSLIQEKSSNANYISLTEATVYEGSYNEFMILKDEIKAFNVIYNRILEETYLKSEKKIDELCLLNGTERYLKLQEEIPEIINLLPQYQIANYLNITAVQLSRIRNKIICK